MMAVYALRRENISLLITDDDDACRDTLAEVFRPMGYRTHTASCGYEAIEIARSEGVHIGIVDFHLPDLTGYETLEIIEKELEDVFPSVMISADPPRDLWEQVAQRAARKFLQKPFGLAEIRDVVGELVSAHY